MAVKFIPESHEYVSIADGENIKWTSVTSLFGKLKQPFERDKIAAKSARHKKSKWYGMTPDEIKSAWDAEGARAIAVGNWYHDQREADLLSLNTIERYGKEIPIVQPLDEEGFKVAPRQRLKDGM